MRAPVALRVNPEVKVDTPHHYTRTGERGNKFGIPYRRGARRRHDRRSRCRTSSLRGLDMHIGSQIFQLEPYRDGTRPAARALRSDARARRDEIRYLDIGGGFAVTYEDEAPMDLEALAAALLPKILKSGLSLIAEPGRFIVGNAGVLLARVMHRKRAGGKEYIISDAGMNDLVRPSHYDAYHAVEAVQARDDALDRRRRRPGVRERRLLRARPRGRRTSMRAISIVVRTTGAYGYVMSFNYNARPRAAEVLVDGDRFAVVTRRETYEDLVRLEPPTSRMEN